MNWRRPWMWMTLFCLHPFGFDDVETVDEYTENEIAGIGVIVKQGVCRRCGRTVTWKEQS